MTTVKAYAAIEAGEKLAPFEYELGALEAGQKAVGGSDTGSPAMIAKMLEFCARHDISPQTEFFDMADVNEAIAHMKSGKARHRVVLKA